MKKSVENQLKKLFESLKKAVESRNVKSTVALLGTNTMINAFGQFMNKKELSSAMGTFTKNVEELAITNVNLVSLKESLSTPSAVVDVEVSFVDTTNWAMKRYSVRVAVAYGVTRSKMGLNHISLSDMMPLGIHKPDWIGGGFGGIDTGGVSPEEPAEFQSPFFRAMGMQPGMMPPQMQQMPMMHQPMMYDPRVGYTPNPFGPWPPTPWPPFPWPPMPWPWPGPWQGGRPGFELPGTGIGGVSKN